MTNGPTYLFDKATWEDRGDLGDKHAAMGFYRPTVTDALNTGTRKLYDSHGYRIVETWSVYRSADGSRLFSVNPDGTLRGMRTIEGDE